MKKKYNSNPFAIKNDQQFYKFCKTLCEDHCMDIEMFRYAIQFDKPVKNLPDPTRTIFLIYNYGDMHILFTRSVHIIKKWMERGEYQIIRQWYHPRPKAFSRSYTHVSFSKLHCEYGVDTVGYDAEIDIVKENMERFGLRHNQVKNKFERVLDKQEK